MLCLKLLLILPQLLRVLFPQSDISLIYLHNQLKLSVRQPINETSATTVTKKSSR